MPMIVIPTDKIGGLLSDVPAGLKEWQNWVSGATVSIAR